MQWLSQREHSRQELRRKLLTHLRNAARRAEARQQAPRAEVGATAPAPRLNAARAAWAGEPLACLPDASLAPGATDSGVGVGVASAAAGALVRDDGDGVAPTLDAHAEVEALLDWLAQHRYLSDTRFVESRVHVRGARYGNLRIRQELAQHGVALSAEQNHQLQATEFDRAWAVWARKFGVSPADLPARAKHMRFLAARGFSAAVIGRVLKQAGVAAAPGHADDPDAD